VSTSDTARTNRDGHPCPPWCQSNHGSVTAHVGVTGTVNFGDEGLGSIWASAILAEHHNGRPVVGVSAHQYDLHGSPYLEVSAFRAEELAGMVELLAALTPDQHRELAAAIRQAAAQITEAEAGL
jgi:hypothetical protein